jgi:flagellar capping protein FliD
VAFCKTGFIPVGFKETVEMTVNAGVGSADTVSQLATAKERRSSETLTPGTNNSSPLTAQATCPAATATTQVKSTASSVAAKATITLRLPYGKDEADYTFEAQ